MSVDDEVRFWESISSVRAQMLAHDPDDTTGGGSGHNHLVAGLRSRTSYSVDQSGGDVEPRRGSDVALPGEGNSNGVRRPRFASLDLDGDVRRWVGVDGLTRTHAMPRPPLQQLIRNALKNIPAPPQKKKKTGPRHCTGIAAGAGSDHGRDRADRDCPEAAPQAGRQRRWRPRRGEV